jgi:hypothetical protein
VELAHFLNGMLQDAAAHCYHSFATFVMQHILEYGSVQQQRCIIDSLRTDLWRAALDMHAVGAIDKALSFQQPQDQRSLATAILEEEGLLTRMALTRKGLPVCRRLLRVLDDAQLAEARRQLGGDMVKLARSKGGKALLAAAKVADFAALGSNSLPETANTTRKSSNTPRQQLMLETMIVPEAEKHAAFQCDAPAQARMASVVDKKSSFFSSVKNAEPFIPTAAADNAATAGFMGAASAHFSGSFIAFVPVAPCQQEMVTQSRTEDVHSDDEDVPWWASTVAEVSSRLLCGVTPGAQSDIIGQA